MSAGIIKGIDRGTVGYCETFGGTWHRFKEYEQINGPVAIEKAVETLGYKVVKMPISMFVPEYLRGEMPENTHGKVIESMYVLVRQDSGVPVYNISVSDDYEIYQNEIFLRELENGIFKANPNLSIESCGSLFAGRIAFVNIMLDDFVVKGDDSRTVTRLMYYNAFGGRAISCCAHSTRIVCNNTLNIAEAQGIANSTLRKFRHTKNAPAKVEQSLVDLAKLYAVITVHKEVLNKLAEKSMVTKDVDNFVDNMFPVSEEASEKASTTRVNKQDEIVKIFESEPDLQGNIRGTRYAMLQAVTNYSQYKTLKRGTDFNSAWFDVIKEGGTRQKFNKKAFDLLSLDEIPELNKKAVLV